MTHSSPLLDVRNLKVHLRSGTLVIRAVDGADVMVNHNECVGIVGESGSGKSTLIRAVTRLMPNISLAEVGGSVHFAGRDILAMSERDLRSLRRGQGFSMIFQDPLGYLNPTQRVGRQISEALSDDPARGTNEARVHALLDEVGLANPSSLARQYPHELSGGMRQRVMIAIALASDPKLLFADEPTTALDATVQLQVLRTLYRLHRDRGMAMVIVTHDLGVVAEICDRVYVMRTGQIVETGETIDLFEHPQNAYSARLIELSTQRFHGDRRL